jgi:GWxTD domain-containing protein
MTPDLLLAAPLEHALGRALLHFLWEGALLAAALRVMLFLGAERPARWRHQAATACLIALPLVFGLTLILSFSGGHPMAMPPPAQRMVIAPVIVEGAPAAPVDWQAWLAPLWMGGVILFYAFRLAGWVRVDRMRRRGVCAAPAEWQEHLRALAVAMRVSKPVMLLESCLAGVPLVIGYWRPVILMPLGALAGLTGEQVEAILIHELAHIRRADYLISMAQSLIEGLFFFHPAVWWISAVVRAEREYSCDDVVVALKPDARAYAAALATLEQGRWPAVQAAAAANGGNLVRRIRRLLGEPAPPRVPSARASALAGALILVAAVAIALVAWPPARGFAKQAAPAAPPAASPEAPETKQAPATDLDEQSQRLGDIERLLADKQKEIQAAQEAIERAQELLRRNAAVHGLQGPISKEQLEQMTDLMQQLHAGELEAKGVRSVISSEELARLAEITRAIQDRLGSSKVDASVSGRQEQLREALQELNAVQEGKSRELLEQQAQAIERAEKQLEQVQKEAKAQTGRSAELSEQQAKALEQAKKQIEELTSGKVSQALREQQDQIARADQAIERWRAATGKLWNTELEKQLQEAQKQLERASQDGCRNSGDLRAQAQPAAVPEPRANAVPESRYQKWLNEDVVYIITAEERAEFQRLRADQERDRFIENFWLRRDPTPGTAENEFKEEHYRRIAYANEHFAGRVAGWRTDRGRVYIVYGPPDEIEDHRDDALPRQVWRYTLIEGVGYDTEVEFTDPGNTGDYRMQMAPASRGSYLQVMIDVSDAADFVARTLRAKDFPALTYPVTGKPGWVRVLVGPYPDEAALAKAKAALEAAGYHPTKPQ